MGRALYYPYGKNGESIEVRVEQWNRKTKSGVVSLTPSGYMDAERLGWLPMFEGDAIEVENHDLEWL